jgi:hypothetical protein
MSRSAPGDGRTLLHLGCGIDVHEAFVNVDLVARAPGVVAHDLRTGIPFPDATFQLVYHSTMLSHLRPADALALTKECLRVLKPGGTLRVVTEDLEQMARVYLEKLEGACSGDRQSAADYEWMILELYDQATREVSGGGMAQYVRRQPLINEDFIYDRVGEQGRLMVAAARGTTTPRQTKAAPRTKVRGFLSCLRNSVRNAVRTRALGANGVAALELGRFRLTSGEVSYRMYDRYSLGQLFLNAGFSDVVVQSAATSTYALWTSVNLDITAQGRPARPHALIMEGIRRP